MGYKLLYFDTTCINYENIIKMTVTVTTKASFGSNFNEFTSGLFDWVTSKKQDIAVMTCLDVSRIPKQLGYVSDMSK